MSLEAVFLLIANVFLLLILLAVAYQVILAHKTAEDLRKIALTSHYNQTTPAEVPNIVRAPRPDSAASGTEIARPIESNNLVEVTDDIASDELYDAIVKDIV